MVENPPAKQETQVQSLGQKDLLEKEMPTHSAFSMPDPYCPEKFHGQRNLAGPMGSQKRYHLVTKQHRGRALAIE